VSGLLRRAAVAVVVATTGLGVGACDEALPEPATPEEYRAELSAICTATTADLDALPAPPEQISVADFATQAAETLEREATRADRVRLPSDDAIRADHRAFVRNTEDQADAWRALAAASAAGGDVGESADQLRRLVLGRNDLVATMGVETCRRDG
jgi:hypothetical protein